VFQRSLPGEVQLLDPAAFVAKRLTDWFGRHPEFHSKGTGKLRVLSSGDTTRFAKNATRFLGSTPPPIEHVGERNGRLVFFPEGEEPTGQFVRGERAL
jgi:glutamate racemase